METDPRIPHQGKETDMSRRKPIEEEPGYETLTPEQQKSVSASYRKMQGEKPRKGVRSRGRSYEGEEPKSWIGKKARALKERFKEKEVTKGTKGQGKIREFYDREIKGGLTEAREELGLEEAMAARGAGVRRKVKRVKGIARKIQKGMAGIQAAARDVAPASPMSGGWGSQPSGGRRAPAGPHFMQSVTQGSVRGPAMNPAAMMGWGGQGSRQPPRRRTSRGGRGRGAAPGTIIIYAGGAAPQARAPAKKPKKRKAPAPRGFMPGMRW
jgi:hypothetical protein